MIDSAVTLLPEPDSPTIATVSFAPIEKDRLRTTGHHAPSTRKAAVSSSNLEDRFYHAPASYLDDASRVERVAQAVADKVDDRKVRKIAAPGKSAQWGANSR